MIIANPIYDTVFKFLLEDIEVAKRLISRIINEDQKWLLSYDNSIEDDEDVKMIVNRLRIAAESEFVREQTIVEELFDESMDSVIRGKEMIIEEKEKALQVKEAENQALLRRIAELEKKNKK